MLKQEAKIHPKHAIHATIQNKIDCPIDKGQHVHDFAVVLIALEEQLGALDAHKEGENPLREFG